MQNAPDALSQLLAASIDANPVIRNKAQQEINNLTNNNLEQFLLELSKKQASENLSHTIQLKANQLQEVLETKTKNADRSGILNSLIKSNPINKLEEIK